MPENLRKRAYILAWFTVGYNLLEAAVSLAAGFFSSSIALKGFGIDSLIESLSGAVMIWRFKGRNKISSHIEERIEKIAGRLVAISFFILSAYIICEAISKLYYQRPTQPSMLGLAIIIASTLIMPILFYFKYRTGKALSSKSLIADSKETLACFFLSVAVLLGLLFNYFLGLWQADPVTGLLIAAYLIIEGIRTLKE